MKSILFVDDEPAVLEGLKFILNPMRSNWDIEYVLSAQEALQRMSQRPFDVIVADIRMPGISGSDLLERVRRQYPHMLRVALSGVVDKDSLFRSIGPAHQFIAKPFKPEHLIHMLKRYFAACDLLKQNDLKRLVSRLRNLPSLPILYIQIMDKIHSSEASLESIGEVIGRDPAMTARILQLVNSAFFGLQRNITNPVQATAFLGIETIRDLALSINVFSQFNPITLDRLGLTSLWDHSLAVATYARTIARSETGDKSIIDDTFVAGLLHDVGKLVLADNMPMLYLSAIELSGRKGIDLYAAEQEIFGACHAQIGSYLLALWGLPGRVVETIAYHHKPSELSQTEFTPALILNIANGLDHGSHAKPWARVPSRMDSGLLEALGKTRQIDEWRKMVRL